MPQTAASIPTVHRLILDIIQLEYVDDVVPALHALPIPIEHEFLVFRGPVLKLWIVMDKPNDPDSKVIVFDPHRQWFGIASRNIGTIAGKGFFIAYCDSFRHALEKAGIMFPVQE